MNSASIFLILLGIGLYILVQVVIFVIDRREHMLRNRSNQIVIDRVEELCNQFIHILEQIRAEHDQINK